jgi:hypothetical protein
MAGRLTTKVLDATILSASLGEIRTVDLVGAASGCYPLRTTAHVRLELEARFPKQAVEDTFDHIGVDDEDPGDAIDRSAPVCARFPYLHLGELTSFLLALTDYELKGLPYYYVTDDLRMRRSIPNILASEEFIGLIGKRLTTVRLTGTIGLIRRLHQRGRLSREELRGIIRDLEESTFRLTPEVMSHLRRLVDEG